MKKKDIVSSTTINFKHTPAKHLTYASKTAHILRSPFYDYEIESSTVIHSSYCSFTCGFVQTSTILECIIYGKRDQALAHQFFLSKITAYDD